MHRNGMYEPPVTDWPRPMPPPTPTKSRGWLGLPAWFWLATVAFGLFVVALVAGSLTIPPGQLASDGGAGTGSLGDSPPAATSAAAAAPTAPVTEPLLVPGSIAVEGTLLVPSEVKPGTYAAVVPVGSFCYWARHSTAGGGIGDIIDSNVGNPGQRMKVTISKTDGAFETSGCGAWAPVTP